MDFSFRTLKAGFCGPLQHNEPRVCICFCQSCITPARSHASKCSCIQRVGAPSSRSNKGNFDKNKGRHGPRADGLPQSAKFQVLPKWIFIVCYNNWTLLTGRQAGGTLLFVSADLYVVF